MCPDCVYTLHNMAAKSCWRSKVCIISALLVVLAIPWLLATVFTWIYAEAFRSESTSNPGVDTGIATLQSVSVFLYIGYIISALLCMFCIGNPKDTCVRFCLVVGIAVFALVPIVAGITLSVTAAAKTTSAGKGIGALCAILCVLSTTLCCVITFWALFCGSKGRRDESRFPAPIALVPRLWEEKRNHRSDERNTAASPTDEVKELAENKSNSKESANSKSNSTVKESMKNKADSKVKESTRNESDSKS